MERLRGAAGAFRHEALFYDGLEDLVLAAHEAATNSMRHGGGRGVLRA